MTHDELAADLAAHLRGERTMVWTDMQLGSSGSVRPDVYTIAKSYVRPNTWRIRSEIEKLRQSREGSPEQRLLKQIRGNLSRIVEQFDGLIEDQPGM